VTKTASQPVKLVGRALFLLDVFLGLLAARRRVDVGAELGALGLVRSAVN
jgi:hypothetical protein